MKRIKISKLIDLILFTNKQPRIIYFKNKKYIYHKYERDYYNYDKKTYLFRDEIDFFQYLDYEVEY